MSLFRRIGRFGLMASLLWAVTALPGLTADGVAVSLFWEDFEGYTSFPSSVPSGTAVNSGIPKISEGAKQVWYGGRFEQPDSTSGIDTDLAVQRFGGGSNNTHAGRFEDDAGLLLRLNTVGHTDVRLSFDWRTFQAESADQLVVGYFVGSLNFGACTGEGGSACLRDFYTTDFGSNQTAVVNWWTNNWTEILRGQNSTWQSVTNVALPAGQASVWVAFWLDNGEGDYGLIDNVNVTNPTTSRVPEPSTLLLLGTGLVGAGLLWQRRRQIDH